MLRAGGVGKWPTMRSYRTEDWLRKEVAAVMQTVVGSKGKNDDTGRRSRWAMPTAGRSREGVAAHGGGWWRGGGDGRHCGIEEG
ncbi:Os04g0177800 [Oryza sativa Japonica Group]|uniref:Os04g0177800 protein n=1 Tax=Oryza sativa subsp. japonica TaxID=39947 RepID=A0A0P0W7L1_ORYSJ|nr:Os04g0177800 [Oryza sativa Japonica Group]